jgi:hypothetical protein
MHNNICMPIFSHVESANMCLRLSRLSVYSCGGSFQTLHRRCVSESLIMRITVFLLVVLVCGDGNKLIIADSNDTDVISNFFITFPSREKNCAEGKVWSPLAKRCVVLTGIFFNHC